LLSGDIDIGLGGFTMISEQMNRHGYTQPFAMDTFRFYATSDLKLSGHNEGWMSLMVFEMMAVHIFTSLAMHHVRPNVNRREVDFGTTAILV